MKQASMAIERASDDNRDYVRLSKRKPYRKNTVDKQKCADSLSAHFLFVFGTTIIVSFSVSFF